MRGIKHQEIVDWLAGPWRSGNRRICVVEGFSGVGKTEVASEFEKLVPLAARVDAPESGELDDLLLDLSEQLAAQNHPELANALDVGKPLEAALEVVLGKPVTIVVDEFQRMLDAQQQEPFPRMAALLERISKRPMPGRLLLLTHRGLDKTRRWGERVAFKTLVGLSPDEGAQLLGDLLTLRGRDADISPEQRPEISRWMGGNPRALRVLVGCLEQDSLDDLTGVISEAWEARDQDVSDYLIASLERELLTRALDKLDDASAATLNRLSVYRKAVDRDAVTRQLRSGVTVDAFVAALTSRFLLDQRSGWFTLNPIVREITLHRLKTDPGVARDAHSTAAAHYARHFTAKQIVNAGALGGTFVEARYHLVQSGEEDQLASITRLFGEHLRSLYSWVTPVGHDASRRDEIIAVLSAYLQTDGPRGMEYYLARLLEARGRPGDLRRALEHARKGTGKESPHDAWVLRLRLEASQDGIDSMLQAARHGFREHPPEKNLFSLYQTAGEMLAHANRIDDAISLLREGITKIPPEKGLYSLYQAAGEMLANANRIDEAIAVLREGITKIPPELSLSSLYQALSACLVRKHDWRAALAVNLEGMRAIAPGMHKRHWLIEAGLLLGLAIGDPKSISVITDGEGAGVCEPPQVALGQIYLDFVREDWRRAAERASHARMTWMGYMPLSRAEAFAWLCAGEPELAHRALARFPYPRHLDPWTDLSWLSALIALGRGDLPAATTALAAFLGRPLAANEQPSIDWLLRLWSESADVMGAPTPAFIFPNLPPSITGGRGWLRRCPQIGTDTMSAATPETTMGTSVATAEQSSRTTVLRTSPNARRILAVGTEWESRHGGLSTFNRDLCTALAAAGHDVVCLIPEASDTERTAAAGAHVRLVTPAVQPGLVGTEVLLLDTPLPADFTPQLVIGHDRKTGPYATAVARRFAGSKLIILIHTRPEDIEWHKDKLGGDDAAITAEQRKELQQKLAAGADLLVGVGPLLAAAAATHIYLTGQKLPVHRLDPGFHAIERPSGLPPEIHCLLLGRAEDATLKGLDIAARALGSVAKRNRLTAPPRLIVRGAPSGTGKDLRKSLVDFAKFHLDIEVRPYSPDVERLQRDILGSSLVLMPSRSEGFGLVGLEAIAAGTPVLVSDQSGLSVLLRERLGKLAEPAIVATHGDLDQAAPEWERAVESVLLDRRAAFARAAMLRQELAIGLTWAEAIRRLEVAWSPFFTDLPPAA